MRYGYRSFSDFVEVTYPAICDRCRASTARHPARSPSASSGAKHGPCQSPCLPANETAAHARKHIPQLRVTRSVCSTPAKLQSPGKLDTRTNSARTKSLRSSSTFKGSGQIRARKAAHFAADTHNAPLHREPFPAYCGLSVFVESVSHNASIHAFSARISGSRSLRYSLRSAASARAASGTLHEVGPQVACPTAVNSARINIADPAARRP